MVIVGGADLGAHHAIAILSVEIGLARQGGEGIVSMIDIGTGLVAVTTEGGTTDTGTGLEAGIAEGETTDIATTELTSQRMSDGGHHRGLELQIPEGETTNIAMTGIGNPGMSGDGHDHGHELADIDLKNTSLGGRDGIETLPI